MFQSKMKMKMMKMAMYILWKTAMIERQAAAVALAAVSGRWPSRDRAIGDCHHQRRRTRNEKCLENAFIER